MVTLLITAFFILAFLAIGTYFWQKPRRIPEANTLSDPPGRGLFVGEALENQALQIGAVDAEDAAANCQELLERAAAGEKSALLKAHQNDDAELYGTALNSFIDAADSDPKLLSLVSYVTGHELPVSKRLAENVIDSYKRSPDRSSTVKTLHIAALSNDAAVYQSAAEVALEFWRSGRLPDVSAAELISILEGEFWVLSSSSRTSGAGFLLKRSLKRARRELAAAHNA